METLLPSANEEEDHECTFPTAQRLRFVLPHWASRSLHGWPCAQAVRRQGYVLEPRPSEIQAALQAIPLMQQPQAVKSCLGMDVRWQVTFEYPWVLCDVHKAKYPQLNNLVQHTPLWVSGHISKIYGDEFTLKNVRLEFEV